VREAKKEREGGGRGKGGQRAVRRGRRPAAEVYVSEARRVSYCHKPSARPISSSSSGARKGGKEVERASSQNLEVELRKGPWTYLVSKPSS